LEEQKKKLRGLLLQKHSPKVTTTTTTTKTNHTKRTTGTTAMSTTSQSTHQSNTTGSSRGSRHNNNRNHRTSPSTMLQRVLQSASKAATIHSPKQHDPEKSKLRFGLSKPKPTLMMNRNTADENNDNNNDNDDGGIPETDSKSLLKDQMRQRLVFAKKPPPPSVLVVAAGSKPEPLTVPVPTEATEPSIHNRNVSTTSENGYETFVQSLINEISSHHHSELYASFMVAMDPTVTQSRTEFLQQFKQGTTSSPSHQNNSPRHRHHRRRDTIVDVQVIQRLNDHLRNQPMSAAILGTGTQLINDKRYYRKVVQQPQHKTTTTPLSSTEVVPTISEIVPAAPTSSSLPVPPKSLPQQQQQGMIPHDEYEDEVMHSRSADSSHSGTANAAVLKPIANSRKLQLTGSRLQLSVEIPNALSSDSTTGTNETSPTTSSTTMADQTTLDSSDHQNHHHRHSTVPQVESWNRIQLRTVSLGEHPDEKQSMILTTTRSSSSSSSSGNNKNIAPEWANITLRPVSCRSETATSSSSTTTTTTTESKSAGPLHRYEYQPETFEKLTMDEIMGTENVTLIRLKEEIINCCDDNGNDERVPRMESQVVIGATLIRHIQYDAIDLTAPVTVLWTLPRHEMEPDGITMNLSTLKITLLLRNHRLSRKVLSLESSEDCLRFATAFYNMPFQPKPPNETSAAGAAPPPREIIDVSNTNLDNDEILPVPIKENLTTNVTNKDNVVSADVSRTEQPPPLNDEEQVLLEKYRELRLTKQAQDALLETIALQQSQCIGIAGNQTDNGALPSNVNATIGSLPSSPISTFTATTVGGGGGLGSSDNQTINTTSTSDNNNATPQWTEEEAKLIQKYRLMIQRGVPADAVRHKMMVDQVDTRICTLIFPTDDKATDVSTVKNETMTTTKAVGPVLTVAENLIAEKYRKMLKLRIPSDAVRHKMVQDQVEDKIVEAVLGSESMSDPSKEGLKPKAAITTSTIRSGNSSSTTLSEEEESVAVQYRKLLKINVSKDALLSRMKQEGVSPKIICAILGQNALNGDDSIKGTAGSTSGSTGSKMISINWDHTENAVAGSVWEVWQNAQPEPMDFTQLKEMFQRKEQKQKDMKTMDATNGIGKAKLLDITRSNNIAISLKAFKEFTHLELSEIIRFLDPIRKIRGERTNFIRDLLPTLTEVKIIDEYNGPDDRLVPAELWFRHLRGIARLERKARVIRTMEMFTADAVEVRDNFRLLADVCRQVMASTKLQDVLGMVLRIGNVMNEGTRNGRAAGFKFHSLLRLTQTKTTDGKITVLDYLVSVFVGKGDTDSLDLIADFPDCHKVSRFLISDMNNEVKTLKDSLEQCKLELAALEQEQNPTPVQNHPSKDNTTGTMSNPHSLLFASILARGNGGTSNNDTSIPSTRKSTESFTKRDEFLAAIKNSKKDNQEVSTENSTKEKSGIDDEKKAYEFTSATFENTLAGGTLRLRKFIDVVEGSFARLEKTRADALVACKDLSRYCGESGGVSVTISLLDVLSQFTKNLEDALKKYRDQQLDEARKLRIQEAKEVHHVVKTDRDVKSAQNIDGTALVVALNTMLKSNGFKETYKKGFVLDNPSETLKMVYEHERKVASMANINRQLDIVSAIQQREETVNDEELEKARSTFAGVQALLDESSPRELTIDQISSFPFSSSDSQSECTISNDDGLDTNQTPSSNNVQGKLLLDTIQHGAVNAMDDVVISSKENVRNATPNNTENGEKTAIGFSFDIRSSQDRLRSRRSLSPSNINSGSLADVLKNLDEIKKQSPSKKIQPVAHAPNDLPSLPTPPPRSVERKSISERAREKRLEKRPPNNDDSAVGVAKLTSRINDNAEPVPYRTTFSQARSPTLVMLDQRQRRLTSLKEDHCSMTLDDTTTTMEESLPISSSRTGPLPVSDGTTTMNDSSFARLARQKRIQKRMSK
jgi:hypothetical protein